MDPSPAKSKTSLEFSTAHHVCNVIRRQVLDEFPHITFNFIVHKTGGENEAVRLRLQEFSNHPAAEEFFDFFKTHSIPAQNSFFMPILSLRKEKKLVSFLAKEKVLISCFINIDHFETLEDLRQHSVSLVWHGLALLEYYRSVQADYYSIQNNLVYSNYDRKVQAWHNMLADAFSAVFMELQGHKNYIKNLGRRRSLMPLTAKTGWQPEYYPYPLVLDAAEIVYEEISSFSSEGSTKPMSQAIEMTKEIGETFDLNAMTQWSVFARAAQEMAWIHAEKNVILGAAIHTSEDPYVRATAYMIAEFLNIEPVLSIDPLLYNPFSDQEISERHHRKACEDIFLSTLSKAALERNPDYFREEALKSHESLAQGKPVGWCGLALMRAMEAFKNTDSPVEEARRAFAEAHIETPWWAIQELNHFIIDILRTGKYLSVADLQNIAAQAGLNFPADAFNT